MVTFTLNGKKVQGEEGQFILQVAENNNVSIPTLCHHMGLEPAGMCRLCTVELFDGRRTRFVTACNYPIWPGMDVKTDTEAVHEGRKLIVELLLARCPEVPILKELAEQYGISAPRFPLEGDDCILCGLCTRVCDKMGVNAISLTGRGTDMYVNPPFQEFSDTCITCGSCASVCPTGHIKLADISKNRVTPIPNEYNWGLNERHPIYVPYAQAIPNTPAIDRSVCVHFKTGGCQICADICPAGAIDHTQQDEVVELDVGSLILAPGFQPFDPTVMDEFYRYSHPNVLTSTEFERILSASGPTMGHMARPSDHAEPKKIAWLQCVGSRDYHRCGNGYCSSVCCMYALKDAMVAKEHAGGELECAIFNMDIRSFGKDYEKYYDRAVKEGIRFVRARVHAIDEVGPDRDLQLRYSDETGTVHEEIFDIVVLSVGAEVSGSAKELAERLGIELNTYNFAVTDPFQPVSSNREGIYVCGVFQEPKDIPSSVTEASAAAALAGEKLASARNTRTKSVTIPEERDVSEEDPRIGVFVCHCGINIAGVVDVEAVRQYAETLPGVAFSTRNLFSCSQDSQEAMKDVLEKHKLNRVVVAACSPKTHEPIFQETLSACGLNPYLFEQANIRNQDSWVHGKSPKAATEKAKDLVRMAVARARTLKPLHEKQIPVNQRALVIGGGVSGMTAALSMAEQEFEVVLVEKEPELGGLSRRLTKTIEGNDIRTYLADLVQRTNDHEKIQVLTESLIVGHSGYKGNFETEVLVGPGMYERKIQHGVIIVATGAEEYKPKEYLYGEDDRVLTQIELAGRLEEEGVPEDVNRVAMIQCIGSRNEENPICSRVCCQTAVKNAIALKKQKPETEIFVLYRDIRTYGLLEDYYKEARSLGVFFSRFDPESPPEAEIVDGNLTVRYTDHVLRRPVTRTVDRLVLSAGMTAAETEEMSQILKVARNPEGYFMEAHVKLRPVDMGTEGVFLCGTAHSPKLISESIAQANAAASRATTFLSQDSLTLSAVTSRVKPELCATCLICVRSCPYNVPRINEDRVSEIDPALCRGCGICAAECPAKAIELNWYEDVQIMSKVDSLLEGVL